MLEARAPFLLDTRQPFRCWRPLRIGAIPRSSFMNSLTVSRPSSLIRNSPLCGVMTRIRPSATSSITVFPWDLRWYYSTGASWTSPVFREWRRRKRAVMVCEVAERP